MSHLCIKYNLDCYEEYFYFYREFSRFVQTFYELNNKMELFVELLINKPFSPTSISVVAGMQKLGYFVDVTSAPPALGAGGGGGGAGQVAVISGGGFTGGKTGAGVLVAVVVVAVVVVAVVVVAVVVVPVVDVVVAKYKFLQFNPELMGDIS